MTRKVLVTGGAGFMGAHVINELLRQGNTDIVALDDLSGGFREKSQSPRDVTRAFRRWFRNLCRRKHT